MQMPSRRGWILCALLFFATALSFLDRQVLSVLAPQLTREFGMSNAVYSRVVFAFVLSYTVMFALGGRLMDAVGTRMGLALSVTVWSVASAAHAFANGPLANACSALASDHKPTDSPSPTRVPSASISRPPSANITV